jgi:hypothetical protein
VTPGSELDRLFGQVLQSISKPAPLAPIDPVDADETNHGVCAQGESDEHLA